jgi:hypothetical protein
MHYRNNERVPEGGATMTLWILFCRMTNEVDTLFTFYAKDSKQAELKAQELLDWYGYERINLKEYRGGFRMVWTYIPGVIEGDAV